MLLSAFVRGRVYLHFDTPAEATRELKRAGFKQVVITRAAEVSRGLVPDPGARMAHVLETTT